MAPLSQDLALWLPLLVRIIHPSGPCEAKQIIPVTVSIVVISERIRTRIGIVVNVFVSLFFFLSLLLQGLETTMSARLGLFQVHPVLHLELHDKVFGATRGTKTSLPLREVMRNNYEPLRLGLNE